MKWRRGAPALICFTALLGCPAMAQERADTYPSRSIRIVVPFPPGGPADIIARIIGQKMTEDWGQAVIVENRAGANTIIGARRWRRRRRLTATHCCWRSTRRW